MPRNAGSHDISFTGDRIVWNLIRFAVPIVLSELLQNLYNTVDSLVVGNFAGRAALAAVSVCGPITNLLVGFFNGMSVGNTVVVARAFGSGDEEKTGKSIRVAFTFSVVLGIMVSVFSILMAPFLLSLTGCNEEIYSEAILYLRIYLGGVMFMVIYNCGTGILRAVGDSSGPLRILTVSCCLNIVLDYILVAVFSLGTAGGGIATILAQGVSVLLIHRRIGRRTGTRCIDLDETFREGRKTVLSSVNIGIAAGLQNALISFSNIFVWSYINRFPTAVTAGIGAANKIDRFVVLPPKALAMTTTTFVSQNIGAEKYRRARKGILYGFALSAAVTCLLSVLLFTFAEPLIGLFSRESAVIEAGVGMSRFLAPFYLILAAREVLAGYLRGYGRSRQPALLSLIGMIGARQLFLALATRRWSSVKVIYAAYPMGWCAAMLLLLFYTLVSMKKMWAETEKGKSLS